MEFRQHECVPVLIAQHPLTTGEQLQQQGIKRALAYRCFQYRLRRAQRRLLRQAEMLFNPA